jgi:WD40-like Beta Propeller Repeat
MIVRRIAALLFLPMMFAFGSGVYLYLGTLKSKVVKERAQLPTVTKPKFVLPGTMFVVQSGRLFKLNSGSFTEIGPAGDWSMPALTPDHTQLVAVLRAGQYSDLYLLDVNGQVIKRLTHDDSRTLEFNHWTFYPHVSSDGSIFYSYDSPKNGYQVDFAIWSMPLKASQAQARRHTTPDPYPYLQRSGGDVSPVALSATKFLFVRHSVDPSTAVHTQIWLQSRPSVLGYPATDGKPLTSSADDCSQPALSPDSSQLAMICTDGKTTRLEVAPFNGSVLGPARVLLAGGLYAQPTWSPDGTALAYYAPAGAAGHFELWYLSLPVAATPSPSASATASTTHAASPSAASSTVVPTPSPAAPVPVQVTQGVDLTATSPPAWY